MPNKKAVRKKVTRPRPRPRPRGAEADATAWRGELRELYGTLATKLADIVAPAFEPDRRAARHFEYALPLAEFRRLAGRGSWLSLKDRKRIVDQALLLFEQFYAHLPLKRSIHAVDPAQQLRLLRYRLDGVTKRSMPPELEFHRELIGIFKSVRDIHTRYHLPSPYRDWQAYLPFSVGEHVLEDLSFAQIAAAWSKATAGVPMSYVVTAVMPGVTERTPEFRPGAEILIWNGAPIARTVARLAEQHAGSNPDARRERGVALLTERPLVLSPLPDEDWVDLEFLPRDTAPHEREERPLQSVRFDWRVYPDPAAAPEGAEAIALALHLGGRAQVRARPLGRAGESIDTESELRRQAREVLFRPAVRRGAEDPALEGLYINPENVEPIATENPSVLEAFRIERDGAYYGLIRIHRFSFDVEIDDFVAEVVKLLERMPRTGCILDIRGNPGGFIRAAERLVQLFTPREVRAAKMQLLATPLTHELCRRDSKLYGDLGMERSLEPFIPSLESAAVTGAGYSRAFELTSKEEANAIGQRYHGPVVLITDANTYSAADMFAAGFQDHACGPVLGVHGNTGAGGANVCSHSALAYSFSATADQATDWGRTERGVERYRKPFRRLPQGTEMTVALRRSLRVGDRAGMPLEDLGVVPDGLHPMTREDALEGGVLLYAQAIACLRLTPEDWKDYDDRLVEPATRWWRGPRILEVRSARRRNRELEVWVHVAGIDVVELCSETDRRRFDLRQLEDAGTHKEDGILLERFKLCATGVTARARRIDLFGYRAGPPESGELELVAARKRIKVKKR